MKTTYQRLLGSLLISTFLLFTSVQTYGQQFLFTLSANAGDDLVVGDTKTISVSFSYVNGSGGTNYLQTEGSRAARIMMRRDNTSLGSISISNPTIGNDIVVNASYPTRSVTSSGTAMTGYTIINGFNGVFPTPGGITTTGSTPIFLGSFTLTGVNPGPITLRFGYSNYSNVNDFTTPSGSFFTSNDGTAPGRTLTSFLNPTFVDATFNVVAIPEPTTWALIILSIASGIGSLVWFKRHHLQSAEKQLQLAQEGNLDAE